MADVASTSGGATGEACGAGVAGGVASCAATMCAVAGAMPADATVAPETFRRARRETWGSLSSEEGRIGADGFCEVIGISFRAELGGRAKLPSQPTHAQGHP